MDVFAQDVQNATLPNYAFLEPQYFAALGNPANDQHPPHSLIEGERLIASVYDRLRSREDLWQHTLFVLLYDEHGGFYDHVAPPATVAPDAVSANGAKFKFDRLGLRVPALLVSPWVGKGRVDHAVYDHTSLLATVKTLFNLPSFLTDRDARARTFEGNFLAAARPTVDTPQNLTALVRRVPVAATPPDDQSLSDNQQALLALARALQTPQSEHEAAGQVAALTRQFRGEVESP
jgi:phospholipase C